MKDFIIGLLCIIGLIVGALLLSAGFMLFVYGTGWVLGWLMNIVIGVDIVFGIPFERLIGLMTVFTSCISVSVASGMAVNAKKLKEKEKNVKEYRGY